MRVLLAQLDPTPGYLGANVAKVAELIDLYPEADLVVLPELFISGYDPPTACELALTAEDPAFGLIGEVARLRATAVIFGFAEQTDSGVANAAACIDIDGSWSGCYRKTHLFGDEERTWFVPGERLLVTHLGEISVGPLICFDMEFPEPARALSRSGASLLVTIAANMAPYGPDHQLAARARALDNRRPHVYVNRVGRQAGASFIGGSMVCGPSGEIISALGETAEVRLVEFDPIGIAPPDVDYLSQVRSDLPVASNELTHHRGGGRR